MGYTSLSFPDEATLRARGTRKWTQYPADVLPLWIAESDAATCPPIMEAVRAAVDRECFGYPSGQFVSIAEAAAQWQREHYGWDVSADRVRLASDVVRGVALAIRYLTRPDSPIVIPTPAYMPFFELAAFTNRQSILIGTDYEDAYRGPNLQELEAAFAAGAGCLVLANPNNPLGFTYRREDLEQIVALADRYNARVISDEIHAPVMLEGSHLPTASISELADKVTVTVTATSKGWNTAGLKCAQLILNSADCTTWDRLPFSVREGVSTLGIAAAEAAYRSGGPWLAEFVEAMRYNRELLVRRLPEVAPGVKFAPNAASYLAWLDFRDIDAGVASADIAADPFGWLLKHARVAVNPGPGFGNGGAGHARLNYATSPEILNEALDRIGAAIAAAR